MFEYCCADVLSCILIQSTLPWIHSCYFGPLPPRWLAPTARLLGGATRGWPPRPPPARPGTWRGSACRCVLGEAWGGTRQHARVLALVGAGRLLSQSVCICT